MQGFFSLKTAADLRDKLRRDLEKLKAEPQSVDAAFNFFVTAEHMLDWACPCKMKATRDRETLLQMCSHLANGAKHFEVDPGRHESVSSTEEHGDWLPPGWLPDGWLPAGSFPEAQLVVYLDGKAAAEFGPLIGAIELAEKVMERWTKQDLPS